LQGSGGNWVWRKHKPPPFTLNTQHTHTLTHTYTQMSGVAKSLGEGTSFQYGLLPGAPDAATGRPPLRDPLICDKSYPASSSSSSNFKIQFQLLQIAYWSFSSRYTAPLCTRTHLFEVMLCLIFASLMHLSRMISVDYKYSVG